MSTLPLKLFMILLFTIASFGMTAISVAMFSGLSYVPRDSIDYTKALLTKDEANRVIDQQLESILHQLPTASTARVAQIREQKMGTLIPFLRYVATNSATRTYNLSSPTLPLSQWKSFLPQLIDDQCVTLESDKLSDQTLRERLQESRNKLAVACPLNAEGYLFGALLVLWPQTSDFKQDRDMPIIIKTAAKITGYLEIAERE
jgi:hypothetical protein